jgi:triosephosphate isomerase
VEIGVNTGVSSGGSARQRLVVGNWKLNGSRATNAALLRACVEGASFVSPSKVFGVCAPFAYLAQLQEVLGGTSIQYGSQDVSQFANGAYTGEVSAGMVADFGCRLAIVGHSERRAIFGESDAVVATKFGMAQAAGLTPILCVGESLAEREAGETEAVVKRQLQAVLSAHGVQSLAEAVVAYEPVWAIGTGKTASPEQAQAVHAFLRGLVGAQDAGVAASLPILYGGSVKASNAAELFTQADIDGGLIGGASLVAGDFLAIGQCL